LADPGLPTGARFDHASGELTWSPTPADAGQVPITFVATDARGATNTVTVMVTVTDPNATVLGLVAAADTSVQTWNTEQSVSYGDNEHLRMLNFDNSARGRLGELYTGGQTGQDAKLTYLSFGLDELAAALDAGVTIASARLSLTYFGPTKGALTGTNTLLAARAEPGWTAGDGKTTPPARSSTVAGAMTWLTKAAVDTSLVVESAPFDVAAAAKIGSDATYSATQTPIGSVASLDVTALLAAALSEGDADLSVALNETKKQDIIFVSTEGAERNPAAEGMAPTLTVTLRQATTVDLSALSDALEAAQGLAPAAFSAESWAPFAQCIARAGAVLGDSAADQESVDAAVTELAAARASLAAAVTTITAVTDGTPVATGEALDPATVTVEATFADGSTAVLDPADWQVTGLDTTSAGDKSVTVLTREQMTSTGSLPAQATLVVSVLDAWSPAQTYLGGERVVMNGSIWSAIWWTRGQQPGEPYGAWQEMRTNLDGSTAWTPSRIFTAGDIVLYDGLAYVAQWWSRNQQPGQLYGPWVRVS
jgi:chitodextrinase